MVWPSTSAPARGRVRSANSITNSAQRSPLGRSLGDYVAKVADSIENGTVLHCFRPFVEHGALNWDVVADEDQDDGQDEE